MKYKILTFITVLSLVFVLSLSACDGNKSGTAGTDMGIGYPISPTEIDNDLAYPLSEEPLEAPTLTTTQDSSSMSNFGSTITGKLVIQDQKSGFPGIYLAQVLESANGDPVLTSLDKNNAPKASIDTKGNFVFTNVKPGKYALLVDLVTSIFILTDTDGKYRIFSLEEGQKIDVGNINISSN